MFKKSILLITLLLTLFSCKNEPKKTQVAKPIEEIPKNPFEVNFEKLSSEEIKRYKSEIEKFYENRINLDEFSGGFLIAKNGQILFEDYQGFSNFSEKTKINAETPLHLASISKVLTASVVLRMVDEQKLSLDDTFQKYFPEFPFEKITIRTLLNHRSGLPNYAYFTENKDVWDKSFILTNKSVLELLATKHIPLEFTPNTKFSYCNTNYVLLALLIEKISNLSF